MPHRGPSQLSARIAVSFAIAALICFSVSLGWHADSVAALTVRNEREYVKIASESRLVLFLHAAPSIDSHQRLPQFQELARLLSRSEPPITFVVIDFSDELKTPFWDRMNGWFYEQKVDTLGYRGYGKILWVSNGHVLDWLPSGQQSTVNDLITKTTELFASTNKSK